MRTGIVLAWLAIELLFTSWTHSGEPINLPKPDYRGMAVEEALLKRRSVREYSADSLDLTDLSMLLFAAQGITGGSGDLKLRTAPSAGATYPIEVYAVVNRVKGIQPGIYRYLPDGHRLEVLRVGIFGDELKTACLGQSMPKEACVSIVLTSVASRTTRTYGERGMRYIYMEAGHICQNICLEATSLGLGSVPVGAFYDEMVNRLLGIDGKTENAIYLVCVGHVIRKE